MPRLLAEGLDVNSQDDGQTALHQAMNYNRVSIVRLLLARPDWISLMNMAGLLFTPHVGITALQ